MTKEEVENIIKRYKYIKGALKENSECAVFYIGNRKNVIPITKEIKLVCKLIEDVYETEEEGYIKQMIKLILSGKSDVFIMEEIHCSKNAYYFRKQAFIEKVFQCCICNRLVRIDEILGGRSA